MCFEEFLKNQDSTVSRDETEILEHLWTKCIDVKGKYIEK